MTHTGATTRRDLLNATRTYKIVTVPVGFIFCLVSYFIHFFLNETLSNLIFLRVAHCELFVPGAKNIITIVKVKGNRLWWILAVQGMCEFYLLFGGRDFQHPLLER